MRKHKIGKSGKKMGSRVATVTRVKFDNPNIERETKLQRNQRLDCYCFHFFFSVVFCAIMVQTRLVFLYRLHAIFEKWLSITRVGRHSMKWSQHIYFAILHTTLFDIIAIEWISVLDFNLHDMLYISSKWSNSTDKTERNCLCFIRKYNCIKLKVSLLWA